MALKYNIATSVLNLVLHLRFEFDEFTSSEPGLTRWDVTNQIVARVLSRLSRSIFGLPLISPLSLCAKYWSTLILALDLVYTAFLIPILVAFEVSDVDWSWGCIVNFVAGMSFPGVMHHASAI